MPEPTPAPAAGAPASPLAVSRQVLGAALGATQVPMALLHASRTGAYVVWVNDALAQALGHAPQDLVGVDVLGDPRVRPSDPDAARAVSRGPSTHPVVLRRRDGADVRCVAHVSPVPPGLGVPGGTYVVAVQDLTAELTASAEHAALVAEQHRERQSLSLIARVSDLLMDVDEPHGLREIANLLESQVVDRAHFFLYDHGLWSADGLEAGHGGAVRHHGPSGRLLSRCPLDPVGQLLSGARDGLVELDLTAGHPEGTYSQWLSGRLAADGPDAGDRVLVQPVPGRRRTVGLLVVRPHGGGGRAALGPSERTVVELVARRVGLSIDNVRLYDREHRLAETLQRAMLPEQAEVDGLDVWTYYSPNADDAQVGGDWYDVLQIDPETVSIVIGDVVGHDVEAAATMGQLRSVVRSYAFDITTPGPVLDRVDQLFGGMRIPRAASMVYSALRRDGAGGWVLQYARAGHLPLLLVRDGHAEQLRGTGGRLVGFGAGGRATDEVVLVPGDVVVFYTDGLVERRDRSLRDGLSVLEAVAAGITAQDAAGIGEDLLSRLADHPEDDVAVVVLRVPGVDDHLAGAVSPRRRRWALPSEPASIGRARHAVVRTCEAWEMPDAANAELIVSELVANAVLHGWGHVALQLYDTGDGLRIEVEDGNPTPPVTTDGHPGRVGGFGMQIVERLADWGWRHSRGGKVVWAKVRPGSLPSPSRRT
ncbi:SpoIIE family protein phosphatase [Cellulomonas dongxiuzhuiae]|uniref:SpoIIE family protein phosphatase n=2 Tax=Cellulomonas dongxiuzhuiae TaxID=2819979 RepID=A0ABX8GI41_9CELL|nr:SpoIIE family protein phosphatase [Cellulomonas dongxiuzhuiae]MBO3088134.1 SpoIIE family protein phosphatase [Cellulomonas dongxiuzhuiae]MBO3094519.1 SpoIIE family protein phosphatase [Cellulomonas dongxiuzhuiae]QWC15542.1 SpoIIE family protein phosphatase [Cellulomonas dongxiuzhuiae]